MRVLQEDIEAVVRPLRKHELRVSFVRTGEQVQWKCLPVLVLYCWAILEAKDMSRVLSGVAMNWTCVRLLVTEGNIVSGEMGGVRSMRGTKMIESSFTKTFEEHHRSVEGENEVSVEEKVDCDSELLKKSSLYKWPSFFKKFNELWRVQGESCYLVFQLSRFINYIMKC